MNSAKLLSSFPLPQVGGGFSAGFSGSRAVTTFDLSGVEVERPAQNPFFVDGPAVISFSGGRTSAMMLKLIIDAHGGQLPVDVVPLFANTGKEMPETLDFVHECGQRWGVPIVWLEYFAHENSQLRWRQVSYETASRNGEPFSDLIGVKSYLPNPVTRFCTVELKIRVMKYYAQQVLGFDHWDVAIGFRADESSRVAKLSNPSREAFDRFAPLAKAGITALDVMRFWQEQPFDLQLLNVNGKTSEGNCDLCFLKGGNQTYSLIRKSPDRALWWIEQEKRILGASAASVFRSDRPSYQAFYDMVHAQGELFCFDDFGLQDCSCTD